MRLTGEQHAQLQEALLRAFPNHNVLAQMVKHQFGQNLDQIAGGGTLSDVVFSLINWAEAGGYDIEDFVAKARDENPGNLDLKAFAEQLQQATIVEPNLSTPADLLETRVEVEGQTKRGQSSRRMARSTTPREVRRVEAVGQTKWRCLIVMRKVIRKPVFIVSVLALVVAVGTWLWPDIRTLLSPPSTLTPPPPTPGFLYQVRVHSMITGQYVQMAEVTIELSGKAPINAVTDTNGLAIISIPSSYAGQLGRLIIEVPGYEMYIQFINLTPDDLPSVVQLEPAP